MKLYRKRTETLQALIRAINDYLRCEIDRGQCSTVAHGVDLWLACAIKDWGVRL